MDGHLCAFGQWYYGEGRKEAEALIPSLSPLLAQIEAPHLALHESANRIKAAFRQPHPGLAMTLSRQLNDHIQWVATLNQNLASEAGGLYTYQAQVKNAIQEAYSMVEGLAGDNTLGDLDTRQALAKKLLSSLKYGQNFDDYLFVTDTNLVTVAHPNAEIVGKDMSQVADSKGTKLFAEIVHIAQEKGEGFLTYLWPKAGEDQPVPKMTYFKLFKPWGWVIGTGVYLDNTNQALLDRADAFSKGEPFSLGVQMDPAQCAFGHFLADPNTIKLMNEFPEFRAAMEAVEEPHRHLHESAIKVEAAVNALDITHAIQIYNTETLPALEDVKQHLGDAIAAEEQFQAGFAQAESIFAKDTIPNLRNVQKLLVAIREEAKKHIMTDQVMLASARKTRAGVSVVAGAAIVLGILLALFIASGITRALKKSSGTMNEAALQVASAAGQVSSASQQLAEGASEQAASLEETSSSLEEMASMTRQNADNAMQANTLMEQTQMVVDRAGKAMKQMNQAMADISDYGQQTGKIIKTIDEIAFQTNLLALNAAVEAARAGEAGAGFAVVADEVRSLAQRAAEAAKNTSELIAGSISRIGQGSELARTVNEAFEEVTTGAAKVAELISEITAASQEQAQGIDQVNQAVAQMDKVTQQNAASAEESASASEELNAQAESMQDVVGDLLQLVGADRQVDSGRKLLEYNAMPGSGKRTNVSRGQHIIPMDEELDDF